jgi:hypothetical protein
MGADEPERFYYPLDLHGFVHVPECIERVVSLGRNSRDEKSQCQYRYNKTFHLSNPLFLRGLFGRVNCGEYYLWL